MENRTAQCHCGQLRLTARGQPAKVSMCHCLDCQRRTGSAFSVAVFYARDQVEIAGLSKTYERPSASGFPVTFHFCGECGSNVFWSPARMPDRIGVALGAFADPEFAPPQQSVWSKDRHSWIRLPDAMPEFSENPPPRSSVAP